MQNAGRTPRGYPVVDVDQGADSVADEYGYTGGLASRWRSLHVSGWEIALWAIALVLIVGSVQLSVYATQQLYMGNYQTNCDSDGVCTSPSAMVYLQSALSMSPAGLAAGLFSAIAAIAIRAVSAVTRHRTPSPASPDLTLDPALAPVAESLGARRPGGEAGTSAPPGYLPAGSLPSVPVPLMPAPTIAGATAARLPRSSFARPTAAPPADTDLSAFQRPSDRADS